MKTQYFIYRMAALGMALVFLCVPACHLFRDSLPRIQVNLCGKQVALEVAATPEAQQRGLMNRSSLPEDHGMLFVFSDDQIRSFWMKDCRIPLSVGFFDRNGRLLNTHEMHPEPPGRPDAQYNRYRSVLPARYAVEMKGGWFLGIKDCMLDLSFLDAPPFQVEAPKP